MGAMLVGMATGFAAMAFSFVLLGISLVLRVVIALVVRVKARRLDMEIGLWAVSGFFLGLWIIPVYIIAQRKITSSKCTACGQQIVRGENYCISCGAPVKVFDDGAFLKRILLIAAAVFVAFYIFCAVYTAVTA
ncbi:MAG: zinc ribbon domain-containing protein [Clostridia bacterium]|nr:zinc ribbon domain-containing protein [Clostridia bacterium]